MHVLEARRALGVPQGQVRAQLSGPLGEGVQAREMRSGLLRDAKHAARLGALHRVWLKLHPQNHNSCISGGTHDVCRASTKFPLT